MSEKKAKIRLTMSSASGGLVSVPMEDLHSWSKAQEDLKKKQKRSTKILKGSPEWNRLLDLTIELEKKIPIEKDNIILMIIMINTLEKLETLEEWLKSKTVNGILQTNEIEVMNIVSRLTPTEETVAILEEMEREDREAEQ